MDEPKKYTIRGGSKAKEARDEERAEVSTALSLGPYTGGPIETEGQLVSGLIARAKAEHLLKRFASACKDWVEEHGEVSDPDSGKTWGPQDAVGVKKLTVSLEDASIVMGDCGVSDAAVKRVLIAMKRRGCGEPTTTTRYRWSR